MRTLKYRSMHSHQNSSRQGNISAKAFYTVSVGGGFSDKSFELAITPSPLQYAGTRFDVANKVQ